MENDNRESNQVVSGELPKFGAGIAFQHQRKTVTPSTPSHKTNDPRHAESIAGATIAEVGFSGDGDGRVNSPLNFDQNLGFMT